MHKIDVGKKNTSTNGDLSLTRTKKTFNEPPFPLLDLLLSFRAQQPRSLLSHVRGRGQLACSGGEPHLVGNQAAEELQRLVAVLLAVNNLLPVCQRSPLSELLSDSVRKHQPDAPRLSGRHPRPALGCPQQRAIQPQRGCPCCCHFFSLQERKKDRKKERQKERKTERKKDRGTPNPLALLFSIV